MNEFGMNFLYLFLSIKKDDGNMWQVWHIITKSVTNLIFLWQNVVKCDICNIDSSKVHVYSKVGAIRNQHPIT